MKYTDLRDALADRGISAEDVSSAYDAAQNYEEFDALMRGPRAERVDGGDILSGDGDFLERLPQIARGAAGDARLGEAGQVAEGARRIAEARARADGARKGSPAETRAVKAAESAALRAWAQANGLLLDRAQFEKDWKEKGENGGEEHQVIVVGDRVLKRGFNDAWGVLRFHTSFTQYLERLAIHNALFPDTAYTLEGFMETEKGLAPIVSQPARVGSPAPRHIVEQEMARLGFARTKEDNYRNAQGVIVEDLHDGNAKIDDDTGEIYFIDPAIFFRPPPARVTTAGERAADAANTMALAERLRARGVNMVRVAQIMGRPSATGAQYTPRLIAVALDDAAFNSLTGFVAAGEAHWVSPRLRPNYRKTARRWPAWSIVGTAGRAPCWRVAMLEAAPRSRPLLPHRNRPLLHLKHPGRPPKPARFAELPDRTLRLGIPAKTKAPARQSSRRTSENLKATATEAESLAAPSGRGRGFRVDDRRVRLRNRATHGRQRDGMAVIGLEAVQLRLRERHARL
jgi:hypothetical protein